MLLSLQPYKSTFFFNSYTWVLPKHLKINMFKGTLLFREKWKNTALSSMNEHDARINFYVG